MSVSYRIEVATVGDVGDILRMIKALAEYEKLSDHVVATEADLRESLCGSQPAGECLLARGDGKVIGFAVYFRNLSTFLGRPGIYLEDLFVDPAKHKHNNNQTQQQSEARIAVSRGYQRGDWSVRDWNTPAIESYKSLGARPIDERTIFRLAGDELPNFAKGAKGVEP